MHLNRRLALQASLFLPALVVPVTRRLAHAQGLTGPAYEVTPWSGPLSGLGLVDTTGKTWQWPDVQGRAVLLNFWASWCEPCRAEMPTLQQVADLYGADKLLVLAINFKEPAARALQFAKTTGIKM